MSFILLIVESPAKCKKIESFLGNKFKCMASYGHFRQVNHLNQIDLNDMSIKYEVCPEKKKNLSELKKNISLATEVVLATDNDREGEAIAWHLCDYFKLPVKTTKRILFQEITRSAILEALNNPSTLNMNLVKAQQMRQILDLLVGFKISPILWKSISSKYEKHLSAGRCQTPALRLIYENYLENHNKTKGVLYNVKGTFGPKHIPFTLDKHWDSTEDKEITEFYKSCLTQTFTIIVQKPKLLAQKPPNPLITSSLQQLASNELHFSPKSTMKYAQELYENGYITYMRTDKQKYSKEFIEDVSKYITKEYTEAYVGSALPSLTLDKTNKEEAHEAIRPIHIHTIDLGEDSSDYAKKLYKLIRDRTLESCMEKSKIHYIIAEIATAEGYLFKHRSEEMVFLGWRIVQHKNRDENKEGLQNHYHYLTHLKKDLSVELTHLYSDVCLKDTTHHVSEAQLVSQLEKKGIGRPSTFSSLVDKIQEREYVKKGDVDGETLPFNRFVMKDKQIDIIEERKEIGSEKNKLLITPVGKIVIEFLIQHFNDLFYYEFTQEMENSLDKVSKGELDGPELCKNMVSKLETIINNGKFNTGSGSASGTDVDSIQKEEIIIDKLHKVIVGKYGPVIKKTEHGKTEFIKIPDEISIDDLQKGLIKMEDILSLNINKKEFIIQEDNTKVIIKHGKYGYYAIKDGTTISLKDWDEESIKTITMTDIKKLDTKTKDANNNTPETTGIVREITEYISLRKSKYGFYLFYKNKGMKKPQFLKVNTFKGNIETAASEDITQWITDTYKIQC